MLDHIIPATLTIMKVDAQTKAPLAGAVLSVAYDATDSGTYGEVLGTCTTTSSGMCSPTGNDGLAGLLPGNYQITELTPPSGYALDPTTASQNITLTPGEAGTITFSDALLVPAAFQKVATGNVNQAEMSLAGAVIDITAGTASGAEVTSCTTNAEGLCSTGALLQSGATYCWRETMAPVGLAGGSSGCFVADNGQGAEPIVVSDAGEFVGVAIRKVDAADPATTLPGAVFDLYRKDGGNGPGTVPVPPSDVAAEQGETWMARATTQADGVALFPLQYPGFAYCVVEEKAPVNYVLSSAVTCTGILSGSPTTPASVTELTVADAEAMVSLGAHKFNSLTPDTNIPGATYDLYVEGGSPPSSPASADGTGGEGSGTLPSDIEAVAGDTWFARGVTDSQGNLTFLIPAGYAWCLLEHSAPVDYVPDLALHCSEVLTTANDSSPAATSQTSPVALPETLGTVYITARKYNSSTPDTVIPGATYELLVEGPLPTGYETPNPDGPAAVPSGTLTGPTEQPSSASIPVGDSYWGEGTTNAHGLLTFAVPAGYAWCMHELEAPADYLPDPGFHCTEVLTNQSPSTATTIALPEVQKPGGGLAFTGGPSVWLPLTGMLLVLSGSGVLAIRRRLDRAVEPMGAL